MIELLPPDYLSNAVAAVKLREGSYELRILPNRLEITHWEEHPKDKMFLVEYRSIAEYESKGIIPKGLVKEVVDKNLQVVEPGAGLSELVPTIAQKVNKPPIVIDPLDYSAIRFLLEKALKKEENKETRLLIKELLGRIAIYQDPNLVTLYNMTLEEACQEHPELKGIADIVIDVGGALLYSDDPERTLQLESDWLLQKNPPGKHYHAKG